MFSGGNCVNTGHTLLASYLYNSRPSFHRNSTGEDNKFSQCAVLFVFLSLSVLNKYTPKHYFSKNPQFISVQ